MADSWREVQLGDVTDLVTGFPFKSQHYTDDPWDPRLVGGDNIIQGSLRWNNVRRWPRTMTDALDAYWLRPGDVVLAMDRPWIEAGLKRAVIGDQDIPALLVQRTARLRGSDELDTEFLRYVIGSRGFTQHVLGVQTGTAVPHISPSQIRAFRFLLPPLRIQRAIAHVLGTLDDKIELNRRMNETLEAMARALFKSWFVDFDPVRAKAEGRTPAGMDADTAKLFPSEFVESDLGAIPKGWRHAQVKDVCAGLFDGPHATPPEATSGALFLGIRNFTPTALDLTDVRFISDSDYAAWTKRVVPTAGDIVFTYEATLGFFALVPPGLRCCLGRRTALVRPRTDTQDAHFLFEWFVAPPFQRFLRSHRQPGSTVDRIWLKDFPSYPVLRPSHDLTHRFDAAVAPVWARFHASQNESLRLARLRDELLPRLLSGELSVAQLDRAVEATA